jgi:hypothetical protein
MPWCKPAPRCAGAYVYGSFISNQCPANSFRILDEVACRTAAIVTAQRWGGTENNPAKPRGCYWSTRTNGDEVVHNSVLADPTSGSSNWQLLCAVAPTGAPLCAGCTRAPTTAPVTSITIGMWRWSCESVTYATDSVNIPSSVVTLVGTLPDAIGSLECLTRITRMSAPRPSTHTRAHTHARTHARTHTCTHAPSSTR